MTELETLKKEGEALRMEIDNFKKECPIQTEYNRDSLYYLEYLKNRDTYGDLPANIGLDLSEEERLSCLMYAWITSVRIKEDAVICDWLEYCFHFHNKGEKHYYQNPLIVSYSLNLEQNLSNVKRVHRESIELLGSYLNVSWWTKFKRRLNK